MEHVNMQAPINRTLAVIDGDLNAKSSVRTAPAVQQPRLLDQVRLAIRTRHYSYKTEESYVHWIKRFIFFNKKRHPAEMSEKEIAQFLSSLASELHVSASTRTRH